MIHTEPSSFEEAVKEQVWKDVMAKEYDSIMKMMSRILYLDRKKNLL